MCIIIKKLKHTKYHEKIYYKMKTVMKTAAIGQLDEIIVKKGDKTVYSKKQTNKE